LAAIAVKFFGIFEVVSLFFFLLFLLAIRVIYGGHALDSLIPEFFNNGHALQVSRDSSRSFFAFIDFAGAIKQS
jgi:hypothetical protein